MILVRQATTADDRAAVLALREATVGRGPDSYDDGRTRLFGAWRSERLVGTLRLTLRREQTLIGDSFYQWEALAACLGKSVLDLARIAVLDRGGVEMTERRRGTMRHLVEAACAHAATDDAPIVVCAVAVSNPAGRAAFTALGFRPYGETAGVPGRLCDHFVMDCR